MEDWTVFFSKKWDRVRHILKGWGGAEWAQNVFLKDGRILRREIFG